MTTVKKKRRFRVPVPTCLFTGLGLMARLLQRTYRVKVHDPGGFSTTQQPWPVIASLWHNRIMILVDFFPAAFRHQAAALASASKDGDYAAAVLRTFGFKAVRGSSSRGGYQALFELKRTLEAGTTVALTLDGPRGPRYEVHPGAVVLAEQTGVPIIPISINAPRRWEFKGWDRTQLPKPFSTVHLVVGAPLHIAPNLSPEGRKVEIARLREAMLAITDDSKGTQGMH